jgi:hypothetical protein
LSYFKTRAKTAASLETALAHLLGMRMSFRERFRTSW